jgi:hypothetical protein
MSFQETNRLLAIRIKNSKSHTGGREPIISPFLPNDVFIRFNKKTKRWECKMEGRGRTFSHALQVYKHFKGQPPFEHDIHHINGDATKFENDHPDNLIAIPKNWNRNYLPTLAREFKVHESKVTEIYLNFVNVTHPFELFGKICYTLYNLTHIKETK